jgi:hypothetical protein
VWHARASPARQRSLHRPIFPLQQRPPVFKVEFFTAVVLANVLGLTVFEERMLSFFLEVPLSPVFIDAALVAFRTFLIFAFAISAVVPDE